MSVDPCIRGAGCSAETHPTNMPDRNHSRIHSRNTTLQFNSSGVQASQSVVCFNPSEMRHEDGPQKKKGLCTGQGRKCASFLPFKMEAWTYSLQRKSFGALLTLIQEVTDFP